jgi:hypothetical protein
MSKTNRTKRQILIYNTTQKIILSKWNATKKVELNCSGRVRSFCSTSGIRRVTLVSNYEATKSLATIVKVLVIYISYLLSHFPPQPSIRKLLTKSLTIRLSYCQCLNESSKSPYGTY